MDFNIDLWTFKFLINKRKTLDLKLPLQKEKTEKYAK